MNILVTGAAGFIGSFLVEALLQKGHKVLGVDNLFRGKLDNIQHLIGEKFTFVQQDLSFHQNITALRNLVNHHNVTTVFHLAAINGTQYFYDQPWFVLDQNITITQNLLASLTGSSVNYFIYTSSSEVYGEAAQFPTPEAHPIQLHADNDRDSYAASKALGEFYVRLFAEQEQIDMLILRVFNTYGERMVGTRYGQVIPEFIQKMLHAEQFTMIGDGKQTRSFCYIQDLIDMMMVLWEKKCTGLLNLGNDEEVSILYLAEVLHRLAGKSFHPIFLPERPNDHKRRKPDLTRIREIMPAWNYVSLEKGLETVLSKK